MKKNYALAAMLLACGTFFVASCTESSGGSVSQEDFQESFGFKDVQSGDASDNVKEFDESTVIGSNPSLYDLLEQGSDLPDPSSSSTEDLSSSATDASSSSMAVDGNVVCDIPSQDACVDAMNALICTLAQGTVVNKCPNGEDFTCESLDFPGETVYLYNGVDTTGMEICQ